VERVIFAGPGVHEELSCTVVAPRPRHTVRFSTLTRLSPELRPPPMLFLWRRGEGEGALFPLRQPLQAGTQSFEVAVPEGIYRLAALPQGSVRIQPDLGPLAVPRDTGGVLELRVEENAKSTQLELRGVDRGDFPLRVYAHPVDEPFGGQEHLLFCGPMTWRLPRADLWSIEGRARIVATGRTQSFVSAEEVSLAGGAVAVTLVPATRLEIRWEVEQPGRHEGAVVDVEQGSVTSRLLLHPAVWTLEGTVRRGLRGAIAVGRGAASLACWSARSGERAWARTVDLGERSLVVDVR
jgi:hypothetical protein